MTPEDLLRGMAPPALPASLRNRILSAARHAKPLDPILVDRVWASRPLWLGWAGLVVALLLGHAFVSLEGPSLPMTRGGPPAVWAIDLGLDEAALPPLHSGRLPRRTRGRPIPALVEVWLDPTFTPLR